MFVSILICTYNRCAILGRTLESLAQVAVPTGVAVELIVIANACTDETVAVAEAGVAALPFAGRCVVEPEAGLSRARNCGVAEAKGDILAFLDDDVWVERGWLEGLVEVYRTTPADMVSGKVDLWWEAVSQPEWMTDRVAGLLSRKDFGPQVIELMEASGAIGANFSFRRKVFETIGGYRVDLGRTGEGLWSGEDTDFNGRALRAGFRMFFAPRAAVRHWVNPKRATVEYVSGVAFTSGHGQIHIKPTFGPRAVVRSTLGYTYLTVAHGVGEVVARLMGDMQGFVSHRTLRLIGQGGLYAIGQRLAGRAAISSRPMR